MRIFLVFFVLSTFFLSTTEAQSDLQSWTGVRLHSKVDDNVSFAIKPIVRHRDNLGEYDDSSIDLSVSMKIGKGFSIGILERYWWLKDGVNRNFWFFDIKHQGKISDVVSYSNVLRLHIAHDFEVDDPNFVRWHPSFTFRTKSKFTPFIGTQLFYRTDGQNELQRVRHFVGTNYKFSKEWSLNFQLWKQDRANAEIPFTQWILVTTMTYSI